MARFGEAEIERYARQMILPQVGGRGQEKLRGARVAVVGAGGLGSPVILYLAAAGVGTIDVIDDDMVDLGNLQRQVLHRESELGMPKVESARRAVGAINPAVHVVGHQRRLVAANALGVLGAADLVLDGSDNFPTRFLVNDACWFLRKPLVTGAILRFEGQVTVFPNDGGSDSPCYRCLFPEMPPPGAVPTCREAGILGPVAGVVGSLQATEALKIMLGIGEPLAGRLLIYDGLAADFRRIRLHRDPECALNGDAPTITGLVDMEQVACGGVAETTGEGRIER